MAEQALALREYPQIVELLAVLEQSGLTKERNEVASLVEYIDSMEEKLGQMMGELQEVHGEVQKIQDKGLYARCTRLLDTAQEKIAQTGTMVSTVKTNFVRAAGNAVRTFQEKGRSALAQAVRAMKIPAVLSKMKDGFHRAAQAMQEAAGKVETKREQLHEAGEHLKNAGRVLSGKEAKEATPMESDKGVLAKVRKCLESMERSFTAMEGHAGKLAERLQGDGQEKKSSVKTELHVLKSEQAAKKSTPARTGQARE